jgi:hypothetical protein
MVSPQQLKVYFRQFLDDVARSLILPHQTGHGVLPPATHVKVPRTAMKIEAQVDLLMLLALLALAALASALYVGLHQRAAHEIAQRAQLFDQGIALLFEPDPVEDVCHGSDVYTIHIQKSTTFT